MFESPLQDEDDLSLNITLEIADKGGHVGFIGAH
jgi:predicted alpha/beta-fold hydrolase